MNRGYPPPPVQILYLYSMQKCRDFVRDLRGICGGIAGDFCGHTLRDRRSVSTRPSVVKKFDAIALSVFHNNFATVTDGL